MIVSIREYALARELQATHLILHSGFIPKTHQPERWLQNTLDFWMQFLADKHNAIDVHIENVYEDRFDLLEGWLIGWRIHMFQFVWTSGMSTPTPH
jgi:hypothetical protein